MTTDPASSGTALDFARDDLVEIENEVGRFTGKVVQVHRDRGGAAMVQVLTDAAGDYAGGQLLTVDAEHCKRHAA